MVKCTISDLDVAPDAGTGKSRPDEFDVNPYKVSELLYFAWRFLLISLHSLLVSLQLLPTLTN